MNVQRFGVCALTAITLLAAPVAAKKDKPPIADQFAGTLVAMSAPGAMGTRVTIWVDAYTADDVAESLATTLEQDGQKALVTAMEKLTAGRIRIGTGNSLPLAVARQHTAADGSRVVLLATNRPLQGFEIQQGLDSQQYPIGFVELKLGADGKGEGTIVGMAQLKMDASRHLSVASYATQPARLSAVTTETKK